MPALPVQHVHRDRAVESYIGQGAGRDLACIKEFLGDFAILAESAFEVTAVGPGGKY